MKTITIGRGDGCGIFIDDYRISRSHALLKIHTFGKMEIVDMGKNGTWVNGIRLRPGVPFPVKRKDVVNFADAAQLNWNLVEDPLKTYKIVGIIAGIVIVTIIAIALIASYLNNGTSVSTESYSGGNPISITDSVAPNINSNKAKDDKSNNVDADNKKINVSGMKAVFQKRQEKGKKEETKKKTTKGNKKATKDKSQGKERGKSYEIL